MEKIKEKLTYDSVSGSFIRSSNQKTTGSLDTTGYLRIRFNGKSYLAHRLAWYFYYGYFPNVIDHINGIKTDNRIENLRNVDRRKNMSNTYRHRSGKLVGSHLDKRTGRWKAIITINKQVLHLGCFNTELEAHLEYSRALKILNSLNENNTL